MSRLGFKVMRIDPDVDGVDETQFHAVIRGRMVGRVGVRCRGELVACVRQLYVDPRARRRGVGTGLLELCVGLAHESGCLGVNLQLGRANRGMAGWYAKRGFVPAHEWDDGSLVLVRTFPGQIGMGEDGGQEHELKTLPEFFREVMAGTKRFEIRENDRDFQEGDVLWLREWDPEAGYSGLSLRVKVLYLTDFEQKDGWVVMSIG